MDHAVVRDRLDAAFLSGGRLADVERDESPVGAEVRAHLASCRTCAAELAALRETAGLLAVAAPDDLRAPPRAREQLLRAVRETGVQRRPSRPTRTLGMPSFAWLAAAAVLALAVVTSALSVSLAAQRDAAVREARELAEVTAASDELLRDPGAEKQTLRDASGAPAGSIIYSAASHKVVVVSTALAAPANGDRYDCWIVTPGSWTEVGWMHYSNGVAYWAGPMQAAPSRGNDAHFVVTLDSRGHERVLEAPL